MLDPKVSIKDYAQLRQFPKPLQTISRHFNKLNLTK